MRRTALANPSSRTLAKRRPRRRRPPAGLGLALIAFGTLLYFRCGRRRADAPACEAELRRARRTLDRLAAGAEDVNHQLGTLRGYCEVAKMKGESGDALARRMDAAIDTVGETSALFQQLLAAGRRQRATIPRL